MMFRRFLSVIQAEDGAAPEERSTLDGDRRSWPMGSFNSAVCLRRVPSNGSGGRYLSEDENETYVAGKWEAVLRNARRGNEPICECEVCNRKAREGLEAEKVHVWEAIKKIEIVIGRSPGGAYSSKIATSTNIMHDNQEQFVTGALEHAEDRKVEGNSFFKEGKHKRAAEEYHNALNGLQKLCLSDQGSLLPEVAALTVTLHSNLTACHQAMGQYEQAEVEAKAALAIDPLHTKAHFRLCKARYSLERFDEAAQVMAIIIAVCDLDFAILDIYRRLADRAEEFKLPHDIQSIVPVASNTELQSALLQGKSHVVLKPGSYKMTPVTVKGFLALIGVGKVEIRSDEIGHAIHVKSGDVYACNLDLVGNMKKSVVRVGGANAKLSLVDCVVQDHKTVGVLIVKGHAILKRCSFSNIAKQAVEVRAQASANLTECSISKCHQGVIAHAGARQLKIKKCEIKDTTREGVLVCEESPSLVPPAPRQWGDVLDLQISSTVVKGCGYHGVCLDMGIRPLIVNSVFVNNSPFAISVKGATSSLIAECHIETGNKSGGICVKANFNANVKAKDNTFVVPVWKKLAIVQEGSTFIPLLQSDKQWSKPAICHNNQIFVGTLPKAPTLEKLEMRERLCTRGLMHSQDSYPQSEYDVTLVRTSRHLGHNLQKATPSYFVGNTFGQDLSLGQDLGSNERQTVRILLGACGDIRNLVKTVWALNSRLHPLCMVQVVLNDHNVVVLARDVLLLSLIAQRISAADVIAIWANHALTSLQYKLLNDALATLAVSLPEWLVLPVDCNLVAELLDVFTSWRDCTMTLQQLLDMHELNWTISKTVQEIVGEGTFDANEAIRVVRETLGGCDLHCFDEEIKQHITSGNVGNVTKEMKSPNPTLLDAPSLQYQVHWSTSIYRAISTSVASQRSLDSALYKILLKTVTPQLTAVANVFERGSLRVAVDGSDIVEGMLRGDFLQLLRQLEGQTPPSASPILFDFIDVSNVSDYVSIAAVVQAAVPLLKTSKHATIHAQSLMWCGVFPSLEPSVFLRCTTGMDLETYQQLLGMKLHTQLVGVKNMPCLEMQWAWELGAKETWLTGAMVLLEVLAAAKLYCGIDRAHYVADVCKGARTVSPAWAGIQSASPLTMLHLLHLTSPNIVMPIVRILVATNDEYRKREWELRGHALFQQNALIPNTKGGQFVKLVFHADADFFGLDLMPLCLVVSKVVLHRKVDVATTNVMQVLEAISYFAESDRVEVMLQRVFAENPEYSSYFMTLCVSVDCYILRAVGTSVPWSKLSIEPLTGVPRWTTCDALGRKRSLLSDDVDLLELIAKQIEDNSTQSWKTHAVFETATFVVVELLLPRPFPRAEEMAIDVTSSGASMMVTTRALAKKRFGFPETHVIELPKPVCLDDHRIKLSRKLCLMTVRLPKMEDLQLPD